MNEFAQYFQILGLEITATPAEIKQAYRSLAKKWHPDRFVNQPQLLVQAQQEIQKINQAYTILKNYLPEEQTVKSKPEVATAKTAPEIHYQRGVEFAELEKNEEAISEFSRAIKLDNNYLNAYQYRAFLLSKLGYKLRADADFKTIAFLKIKQNYQPQEPVTNYHRKSKSKDNQHWYCLHTLLAHKKIISALALSQDNQFFVSASHDKNIKLWNVSSAQVMTTLRGNSTAINSLALSNNGKILITGNQDKTIYFWNLELQKILKTLSGRFSGHSQAVIAIALDCKTNTLISAGADNLLKIWDLDRGKEIQEIACRSANITCLTFNESKGYFCNGGLERQLRIREINTGQVIRSLRSDSEVFALAFSPNGKFLAAGQINGQIIICNVETGARYHTLIGHQDRISALTFSADNQTLISGSWDGKIKLWNVETDRLIDSLSGHTNAISALAITKDNRTIISGSRDCTIKIWRSH
jgi:WD40 repeat protein